MGLTMALIVGGALLVFILVPMVRDLFFDKRKKK